MGLVSYIKLGKIFPERLYYSDYLLQYWINPIHSAYWPRYFDVLRHLNNITTISPVGTNRGYTD